MINKPERIKNVFLKTLMLESECFIKLKKLIFDGPKYLLPLVFLLIAVYSISNLAWRENMAEFDKALSNINDIENIK